MKHKSTTTERNTAVLVQYRPTLMITTINATNSYKESWCRGYSTASFTRKTKDRARSLVLIVLLLLFVAHCKTSVLSTDLGDVRSRQKSTNEDADFSLSAIVRPASSKNRNENEHDLESETSNEKPALARNATNSAECKSLHPLTCLVLQGKRIFLLQYWEGARVLGLGAQIGILLTLRKLFEDTQGRLFVLDQSKSTTYRYNETVGLFSGFFQTDFPVLDGPDELGLVKEQLLEVANITLGRIPHADRKTSTSQVQVVKLQFSEYGWQWEHSMDKLWLGLRHACPSKPCPVEVFEERSQLICKSITMRPQVQAKAEQMLANVNIPPLGTHNTIGFHIRRGDKLIREARAYKGEEYVTRLLKKAPQAVNASHCFLATDDMSVRQELKAALLNYNISCQLHSFAGMRKGTSRSDVDDTFYFFAELHALSITHYFVGTFSSAIGRLVSLWRGCASIPGAAASNYYHSYGADTDHWSP
jgi:hypothetical protein